MAFVGLGVTGGIGAYKSVEVARLLQKRGHRVQAVMTRNARRFVGPLTFEAITREPVITSTVRAWRQRQHRTHRARVDDRSAARRPGHRQQPREVRARPGGRLSVRAVPCHARPRAPGARHEHEHVGPRRDAGKRRHASRAWRELRRPRRGIPRVRLGRRGPSRGAGHDRGRRLRRCSHVPAVCPAAGFS